MNDVPLWCPVCHADLVPDDDALACPQGDGRWPIEDDVPVLLRDPALVEQMLAEARESPRAAWYERPQEEQFTGPYRHHTARRWRYLDRVLEGLRAGRTAPLTALDLGCGDGGNGRLLRPHVDVLHGSDYNVVRLRRAATLPEYARVFLADATDHPAPSEHFDLVFCNHVIEHIPDDTAALSEIRRILAPGGLGVIGIPNEGAAWWQLAYRLQPSSRAASDHVHYYTATSFRERAEAAGLVVQHVEELGWGLPHWRLDAMARRFRPVEEALERLGRRVAPGQASSLYVLVSPGP